MDIILPSNYHAFTLRLTISTKRPEEIVVTARDPKKKDTWYYKRVLLVKGQRTVDLKFPISPQNLVVSIYNKMNGNQNQGIDPTFKIENKKLVRLRVCDVWFDKEIREFYDFALQFAENAGIYGSGRTGASLYGSDDGKFKIAYYNIIRDKRSGKTLSTPARVGHNTGIIEVSEHHFKTYTVPMRLIILLHEFSHKYMNHKIGRKISDETAADINGLNIYLSMGWSEVEAQRAFLNVFGAAKTEANHKRYKILNDFITKFSKGQIASCRSKNVA